MHQIIQWPSQERPREKLLKHGPQALSDAELLAIFLRTGVKGKNAIQLAREIIQHFGTLGQLLTANKTQFCQFKGLGEAKFAQLIACLEMNKRVSAEEVAKGSVIEKPQQVKQYFQSRLMNQKNEVFAALFLDNQHQIIAYEELFYGTVNTTIVHPRVIIQRALAWNAAAIIVAHNHPSGHIQPSQADIDITQTLKSTLEIIDVRLLDHLIIAAHRVISLAEQGHIF
ncbi:RadC family protein [Aliikangiella maris]|uniref:DNA repair protein RadC n=2 Tax=Aliikangiella maris TaxID=3162458 RepID=A0ABV3MSD0_9GAMM